MKNLLILLLISIISQNCNRPNWQNNQWRAWAINNTQEIKALEMTESHTDLSLLKEIVGDASIVCLGESRHDLHEQFQLKLRFIKYLVEELNFTTFALEASLPYSKEINGFILDGNGDIDQLLTNMPGWFLWDTEEIKELLLWLRAYNEGAEHKVNFYGFDIVAPNEGLNQIFEYLEEVDTSFFVQISNENFGQHLIEDNFWMTTLQRYGEATTEEKNFFAVNYQKLLNHIRDNKIDYISKSSEQEYEWIAQLAFSANAANKMFSSEDRVEMGLIRDGAMAEISSWIIEQNQKTIIWAHNVHIAKSDFVMSMFPDTRIKGMGHILSQQFQEEIVSIGAAFDEGTFEDENRTFQPATPSSIDGMLATLGMDYFLMNLDDYSKSEAVITWLLQEQLMQGQEFEMSCIPSKAFDAFFFTKNISKVRYNRATLERLRN